MENEVERAIAIEIAARSPFSAQEVYSAWEACKSFDMVLAAVNHCAIFNISLSSVISFLSSQTPEETETAKLERK